MNFEIIDRNTNLKPDIQKIILRESWAKSLSYNDPAGFAIQSDGTLILTDECGKFVYCPSDRFQISFYNKITEEYY